MSIFNKEDEKIRERIEKLYIDEKKEDEKVDPKIRERIEKLYRED